MHQDCVLVDEVATPRGAVLDAASRAATGLAALGIGEGDAVALLLRNDAAFLEAQAAVQRVGAYAVPLNWHLTPDELRYILADCAPRLLVAHADLLAAAGDAVPAGLPVLAVATPAATRAAFGLPAEACQPPPGRPEWRSWLAGHPPCEAPPRPPRQSMIYTSGTTGRPKGVRRGPMTPEQARAYRARFAAIYGLRPGLRAWVGGPLYHASPNAFARLCLPDAGLLALSARFDPETLLRLIEAERLTHLVMVPTMFVRLLRLPEAVRRRHDLSSLEWVTHTAAPCPVEVKRALIDWWGPIVVETYGGTEVGAAVACTSAEWLARPGTVGRPLGGARLRVVDEAGRDQPPGRPGEIFLRCPDFPDFTYNNRPEDRAAVELDGLISCGDVGYVDEAGFLFLCDRKRDMVISAGVNIYPAEVEAALVQCPGVRDCAVFGVPDAELGETLVAAVEPDPAERPTEAAMRDFLAARLARYKLPRRYVFHDRLPREESGKIMKRRLRDPHWEGRHAAI